MTISRRRFLGGLAATTLAAPFYRLLEQEAYASTTPGTAQRLLVFFTPNGTVHHLRRPTGSGTSFAFPSGSVLEPLQAIRDKIVLIDGLDFHEASNHEGGMHAMLTGKGGSGDVGAGASVDQYIAAQIGGASRFPSLPLAVQTSAWGGSNQTRMTYAAGGGFVTPDDNPANTYQRLFGSLGGDASARTRRLRRKRSVLQLASADLADLRGRLGTVEQTKLDKHIASLAQLENGLVDDSTCNTPLEPVLSSNKDDHGVFDEVGRAQMDLMVAALACDHTRVASLQWSHTVGPHVLSFLPGVSAGHHTLSHAGDGDTAGLEALRTCERWFSEQFVYLVDKLDRTADPVNGGSLLDSTLVVWAKEMGDSRLHVCEDVPFVLAGSAGGRFETGRYLRYNGEPHNHLLVSICQALGLSNQTYGAAFGTGPLPGLA